VKVPEAPHGARRLLIEALWIVSGELQRVCEQCIRRKEVGGFVPVSPPLTQQARQHSLGRVQTDTFCVRDVVVEAST
jgi:hypothetical protein